MISSSYYIAHRNHQPLPVHKHSSQEYNSSNLVNIIILHRSKAERDYVRMKMSRRYQCWLH